MKPETKDWLRIADHDIGAAASLLADGYLQGAAFFCQQAVEKLLKAKLTEQAVDFPKTHDLAELADLADLKTTVAHRVLLARLSDHAVESRYPGADYNEGEIRALFDETKDIFEWLRAQLS